MPHQPFEHRPHRPQREHVETDVPQRRRLVQEHGGDERPWLAGHRSRLHHAEAQHAGKPCRPYEPEQGLQQPHGHAYENDCGGHHRLTAAPSCAQRLSGEYPACGRRIREQTKSTTRHGSHCTRPRRPLILLPNSHSQAHSVAPTTESPWNWSIIGDLRHHASSACHEHNMRHLAMWGL